MDVAERRTVFTAFWRAGRALRRTAVRRREELSLVGVLREEVGEGEAMRCGGSRSWKVDTDGDPLA
jgi:hypothetical protein